MSAHDMPADYDAKAYQETIDAIRLILHLKPLYKKEKYSCLDRWASELGETASVHYNRTRFAMKTSHTHHTYREDDNAL